MSTEWWLAWIGYLAWLSAGLGDFLAHWRTDLPHTSGVPESATHLLQLALLAAAVIVGLAFEVGPASAATMGALVVAHAIVGYIDTRIAFARHRVVSPIEQHIHSVLDMAPPIAFAWLLITTWPAAVGEGTLALRDPALPIVVWMAFLVPPVLLCVVPALIEFRAAWRVRRAA